ncbi:thiol reductase thioredoxin [Bacillus sp. AFS015802]|uniref:thioredoxin family protein n=1 Tax=Bacillus sp. AFS015802 TaxID=2033486 RepID=UPI000BF866D6|nr:thioredoxin family protein [Bacillus sp. AFS015802]PFA70499.1 thiol reductase thioredoxin [Bacillus sp. AFS015802]
MEVSSTEALNQSIEDHVLEAVYLYTPMCGTCQVAGKMMDVVEQLPQSFHFVKANLNYLPQFAEGQSIESVPCLLLFKDGVEKERIYAFQSVPFLYETMTKIQNR